MSVKIRTGAYNHRCIRREDFGTSFEISWTIDVAGTKIRSEKIIKRLVNEKTARKFCEKHEIKFPETTIKRENKLSPEALEWLKSNRK